jgi:chromosome condensin MukBEF ATPase and DNA-binding subunit MukB
MSRIEAAKAYLRELVVAYESLERERQQLLAATTRLDEIQAEKADLVADAQAALDKLNALQGTSYTLAQVRKFFVPTPPPPPESP